MRVGVPTFVGERLHQARVLRGRSKKELGELVGVSPTMITNYERNTSKPEPAKVDRIALALSFPRDFFDKPHLNLGIDRIFWRSRKRDTKAARASTEARMQLLAELFAYLEEELDFPEVSLPTLGLPGDFRDIDADMIEQAAETMRAAWRLRDQPIPDMILFAENAGVPVTCLRIDNSNQDGLTFTPRHLGRPFIGINTYQISTARARYDVAHELGHAILHANVRATNLDERSSHDLVEAQAHQFAGALLFPREAYFDEVRLVSLDAFSALKRRWGISIAAMIMRGKALGMISEKETTYWFRQMQRRGWRGALREPYDTSMPLERPRMLGRALTILTEGEGYGISSALSALRMPASEIAAMVGTDLDTLRPRTPCDSGAFAVMDVENDRRQEIAFTPRSGTWPQ